MVSDHFFYPLIALVLAGLVWIALAFGPSARDPHGPFAGKPINGIQVSGKYLEMFQNGPGLIHELTEGPDGEKFVRAAAGQRWQDAKSAGVFITVPPSFARAWEGHTLEISARLRQPAEKASDETFLRYYVENGGNSQPAKCEITREWQECRLVYHLPAHRPRTGTQFIGIWPDAKGLSRYIEIGAIAVKVLPGEKPSFRAETGETQ